MIVFLVHSKTFICQFCPPESINNNNNINNRRKNVNKWNWRWQSVKFRNRIVPVQLGLLHLFKFSSQFRIYVESYGAVFVKWLVVWCCPLIASFPLSGNHILCLDDVSFPLIRSHLLCVDESFPLRGSRLLCLVISSLLSESRLFCVVTQNTCCCF